VNIGLVLFAISLIWLGSEIVLARVTHSKQAGNKLDRSSLRLLWTVIVVSIVLANFATVLRVGSFGNRSTVYPVIGIVLIVCGLALRWVAILSLKRQFTVDVSIVEGHRIISEGIYRYVRHPAYSGSLVSFFGLGLCYSNYVALFIVFVPICGAFLYRINIEERALVAAFGSEYVQYCASTKRLIPGVY
jgi:protein-S-isoprenylcysteine O-methyltransferase Ste14